MVCVLGSWLLTTFLALTAAHGAPEGWYCPVDTVVNPQGVSPPPSRTPNPPRAPSLIPNPQTPLPPPAPPRKPIKSVPIGAKYEGYGTYFEGYGIPYGGCGVPQSWTVDQLGKELPFVALNTFSTKEGNPRLPGLFDGGKNCGRWLRIVAGDNCIDGSNDLWRACIVSKNGSTSDGKQNYKPDAGSGTVLYGYVGDSCGDNNLWCRGDPGHIDISQKYLADLISKGLWGNRRVSWQFMTGPPGGYAQGAAVSFGWAKGAFLPYYPAIIVYRPKNGVSKVSVKNACGDYLDAVTNGALGQMWVLPGSADFGGGKVTVRVFDVSGRRYGTFSVEFPCAGTCGEPTLAASLRI